jgi:hypothetical protein
LEANTSQEGQEYDLEIRNQLVSIHKWPFSAIADFAIVAFLASTAESASNCGVAGATDLGTPPRNPLFSLTLRKIAHF